MNKQRRTELRAIIARIEEARDDLDSLQGEEREAFEGMPESLQQGDRGQTMEQGLDTLQQAFDSLDEAASSLNELCDA